MLRFITHIIAVLFLTVGQWCSCVAQQIGIPETLHFEKTIYKGGALTSEISSLSNGYIVAANNDGLLIYDGVDWNCLTQPKSSIMRSIQVVNDTVFCGGQNELGFFEFSSGSPKYHDISASARQHRKNLGEIWDIEYLDGNILVRSEFDFFILDKKGNVIDKGSSGLKLVESTTGDVLHFTDSLCYNLTKQSTFPLPTVGAKWLDLAVTPAKDTLLFTIGRGIIPLNRNANNLDLNRDLHDRLMVDGVNHISKTNHGIAVGTQRGGLILLGQDLQIRKIISVTEGLYRNGVLSVFEDNYQNLWLGMNNGIDVLKTGTPFRFFSPDGFLKGSGYSSALFKGNYYFGTNNGAYIASPDNVDRFELIPGTTGQVWGMRSIAGVLWICHHEGLFVWDGNSIRNVYSGSGCWDVLSADETGKQLIVGKYDGLGLLEFQGNWSYTKDLRGLSESSRILAKDSNGKFWVSHPYIGAWSFEFDNYLSEIKNLRFYNGEDGFPSDLFIYVANINDETLFTAEYGLYAHNSSSDAIQKVDRLDQFFPDSTRFLRLFEGINNQMWYVTENELGLIDIQEKTFEKQIVSSSIPGLKARLVNGFEHVHFIDPENVFIGVDNGFARVQIEELNDYLNHSPQLIIRSGIEQTKDSIFYSSLTPSEKGVELSANESSIQLKFAPQGFLSDSKLMIQTQLEEFELGWETANKNLTRDYTNLHPGEYLFHVRLVDQEGTEITRTTLPIEIKKPWYLTPIALTIWVILFVIVAIVLYKLNSRHNEKERQAILEEKELELEAQKSESDFQINQIESERLEAEIVHKNKELASATMHLVQKGKVLQGIRDALQQMPLEDSDKSKKEVRRLIKMINSDIKLDDNWQQFELHFDQVHVDFLTRLREKFPQLTPNDHKLCAYLRMNLTTKEIATIMNISIRGVEISRYRLRKKLDLQKEKNLTEFIQSV